MSPSTSRPYGGAGTRLNAESNAAGRPEAPVETSLPAAARAGRRRERLLIAAVLVAGGAVGVMLYLLLFRFVDDGMNGAFVDWFFGTFVSTWEVDYQTGMTYNLVFDPTGAKEFFLRLGLVFVLVLVAVATFAAYLGARRGERRAAERSAGLLSFFMRHDAEASEVFPEGLGALALTATEVKQTMEAHERALREEAERRSDLVTYLAHDLKTPLTSVIGYLSLLDEVPEMPREQRCRYVGVTLDKAKRLERLINEFFDITRYNLSHIELEVEPVDLSYLLVQMADEFYPLLQAHGNTCALTVEGAPVSVESPGAELVIEADPGRLARVFNNILKNAVAYSREGTEIAVAVERVERDGAPWVRVAVTDEGATIPPHKLKAIFDKFFRLDETRATSTGGAGLGLAIAREIVELHGGAIAAASEAGITTFTVELPA